MNFITTTTMTMSRNGHEEVVKCLLTEYQVLLTLLIILEPQ